MQRRKKGERREKKNVQWTMSGVRYNTFLSSISLSLFLLLLLLLLADVITRQAVTTTKRILLLHIRQIRYIRFLSKEINALVVLLKHIVISSSSAIRQLIIYIRTHLPFEFKSHRKTTDSCSYSISTMLPSIGTFVNKTIHVLRGELNNSFYT